LVAIADGRTVRIGARKAVVFGSGGFAHNTSLISTHQTFLYGSCAKPTATGDFIAIAEQAGAKMGNLQSAWRSQVALEEALENRILPVGAIFLPGDSMLVVNKYGKRALNEKRDYNDRTRAHFYFDPVHEEFVNQFLFMVFDDRALDTFSSTDSFPTDRQSMRYIINGSSLADLSAKIRARLEELAPRIGHVGLTPKFGEILSDTVARFNQYSVTGTDPDFSRGKQAYDRVWHEFFSTIRGKIPKNPFPNITMHPISNSGPYYAIILAAGALDTSGGPMINEHAQVLGADGSPIRGLYGAGNCIASPSREAYFGAGGTIGLAMTFAYIAANHAIDHA
jgi:hypothetical protein